MILGYGMNGALYFLASFGVTLARALRRGGSPRGAHATGMTTKGRWLNALSAIQRLQNNTT